MKKQGIDAFWLKVIAIVGMTLDHIGMAFGSSLPLAAKILLYLPGGLTFPIMAYLLVEGYKKTSNVRRYMRRMFVFALVALLPFMWAFSMYTLNVLVTLLLGLVVLYLYDNMRHRALFYLAFAGITIATVLCDWGLIGVPMIFAMYVLKGEKKRIILPIGIMVGAMEIFMGMGIAAGAFADVGGADWPQMAFFVGSLCAIPLLLAYNGERGRNMKYFFYAYYPAHLFVLGLLRALITGKWLPWL